MGVITKDSISRHHGRSSSRSVLRSDLLPVVSRVRFVLRQGNPVYLCDTSDSYKFRVTGIRFSRKVQSLQVQASCGWLTIWDTERLTDQHGDCLFESSMQDQDSFSGQG
jgi:hypothetical protein